MKTEKNLHKICDRIRSVLFESDVRTTSRISSEFRDYVLRENGEFMSKTSKPEDIKKHFEKLCIQFRDALEEKNLDSFIRKCADFHFDFLKVHPYGDANGRTSRILLSLMLGYHNILLPTLNNDYYEKYHFYKDSNAALVGDYRKIEQLLFERLSRFYPSIIPPVPTFLKTYNESNENEEY